MTNLAREVGAWSNQKEAFRGNQMKVVILAGGRGTRMSEYTSVKPKPMVEIGGFPILWHLMKIYSCHGLNDFVICHGYLGHHIKSYFLNYVSRHSDISIDLATNTIEYFNKPEEQWKITLADTGEETLTATRLKNVEKYLEGEKHFCFTYGDGLTDLNIAKTIDFHINHGKLATITAVGASGRYGAVDVEGDEVIGFAEKPKNNS